MAGLSCGIVGLPNVGKSTLFNALTASQKAMAANYPFCTIEPNVGIVEVIDKRLDTLSEISKSKRVLYATTEFVDIAGLVEGASKGEGLGNAFLTHIRETDAIAQVIRCFDSDVIHVKGRVNPVEDAEIINLELILADLGVCDNMLAKMEKQVKVKKDLEPQVALLKRVQEHLNKSLPVRQMTFTDEEAVLIKTMPFMTLKKMLYVANVSENDLPSMENKHVAALRAFAEKEGAVVVVICAKIEEEIAQLEPHERKEFLESVGLEESGLQRLVRASFKMLGLVNYITTGEMETRAWTIVDGTPAFEAAGKIHSDIQKGFVRAEVVTFEDFCHYKGTVGAKAAGKVRAEGREYKVRDGDIINFLHTG